MTGMLKRGDPCPCHGQPIRTGDPDILPALTWLAWAPGKDGGEEEDRP